MTRRLELTPEQQDELQSLFRATDDRRLRNRCQAILMVHRGGRTREQIALDVDTSPRTLRRWVGLYQDEGLEGLRIDWYRGSPHKIPDSLAPTLLDWVRKGPVGCGLDRANWTYEELAHHLFQKEGIQVCAETMRQFCRRHGVRCYRPTYRYLRGDPDKQAIAAEELDALKKSPGGGAGPVEPGRGSVPDGADAANDAVGEGRASGGRDVG